MKKMEDFEYIAQELRKMGLDRREAQTYLILLEYGGQKAQELALRLKISRPTVYRVLATLEKKGLVNKQNQKKQRSIFSAASPDSFLSILRVQRRRVEEQEREFLRIISVLQGKYHLFSNKSEIKTYQGKGELNLMLDDLALTRSKTIFVLFSNRDQKMINRLEKIYQLIRKRLGPIAITEIFPRAVSPSKLEYVQRVINSKLFLKENETVVITGKVFHFLKKQGYLIENQEQVDLFRSLAKSLAEGSLQG